jgi:hypothetical protein
MESAFVTVDVRGITGALDEYDKRVSSIRTDFLAEGLSGAVDDVIQSEGFGNWPALSATTVMRHPERAGGKLLQDKGQLASIQTRHGYNWAEAWSPAPYAGYHITGTKFMDARDWTDIKLGELLEDLAEIAVEQVVR